MASESALFDQLAALIGQPVRVRLQDDTSTDGVLYCIDPDTDHVALLCFSGPRDARDYSVKILLAHHVRGIAKEPQDDAGLPTLGALREELLAPAGDVAGLDDTASDRGRRERLCQFLTKVRGPSIWITARRCNL
ncbi:unnamed protein product [Phytophthora lilii]|uniref:Unnamed protein product n=1 Tax=Phytophthora lilii TaxID=2077276 RepID=A0A9W6WMN3_9STRA|nr:unnamed protein product [Phytophthora lilii]